MEVFEAVVGLIVLGCLLVFFIAAARKEHRLFLDVQNANIRMCEKVGDCADAVRKAVKNDL